MIIKKFIAIVSVAALSAGILATSPFAAAASDAVIDFTPTADGYEYAGYVGGLTGKNGEVLAVDITTQSDTDLSGLRFEFTNPAKTCWASQNDEGTLYTVDGNALIETELTPGEAKTVYIDLLKSGASVCDFHVHTNGNATGAFKLANITIMNKSDIPSDGDPEVPPVDEPDVPPEEDSNIVIDFTPTTDDYEYAGYVGGLTGKSGEVLAMDITIQSGTDLSGLRFKFTDPAKTCWASQNDAGTLYTTDGKTLIETEFAPGESKTVYIDLSKSGASACDFHVHTNGNATGAFKLANVTLMNKSDIPSEGDPDVPPIDEPDDPNDPTEEDPDAAIDFKPTTDGYEYAGYVEGLAGKTGNVLVMDITTQSDTDLSGLRFEFTAPKKICWASQNNEGTLYTTDGKTLIETQFTAGEATTVHINLVKSGASVSDFHVHTNGNITGAFKLANIDIINDPDLPSEEQPGESDSERPLFPSYGGFTVPGGAASSSGSAGVTSDAVINFNPTTDGYEYAGFVGSLTGNSGDILAIDITTQSGTDLTELRFEFIDSNKVCWASENDEGTLYTVDGKSLAEMEFTAGETKTVYIDLKKSGVSGGDFHVHTSGTATGAFKLANITLMNISDISSEEKADETVSQPSAESEETTISEEITDSSVISDNVIPSVEEPIETVTQQPAISEKSTDNSMISGNSSDFGNPDTGIEGVAVAVGIAVLSAGVIVIAKKKR